MSRTARRKKYATVFKLLRLAAKNASAGEARAALHQAKKLIAQLDAVMPRLTKGVAGD